MSGKFDVMEQEKGTPGAHERARLLFVDDEESIRLTLPAILERHGFEVSTAATVPEALRLIGSQKFDVLVSDLNIGEAGDGFTVVSAMRRTQPNAPTFILTGYPAFESALEAIRQQVDAYLIKPADVETLVATIQEKLTTPNTAPRHIEAKRLAVILEEHKTEIMAHWLELAKNDVYICSPGLSDDELTDHLPAVLEEVITSTRERRQLSLPALKTAQKHGKARFQQGCDIPSMIREARILHEVISQVVEERLLEVDVSSVITDVMGVGETLQAFLEESIRSYVHERDVAKGS